MKSICIIQSKYISTSVTIILLTNILSYSQSRIYDYTGKTYKILSEDIEIKITPATSNATVGTAAVTIAPLVGAAFTAGTSVGINVVNKILEKRAKKFSAQYEGSASEELFYDANANFNISKIDINKKAVLSDGVTTKNTKITLIPDVSADKKNFRFNLSNLQLAYSRAKIKKSGNNGKKINLNIEISITASWPVFDAAGKIVEIKTDKLGTSSIILQNISPDGAATTPGKFSGWFQFVPNPIANSGNYQVDIVVKEVNPYQVKAEEMNAYFKDNSGALETYIKALVGKDD